MSEALTPQQARVLALDAASRIHVNLPANYGGPTGAWAVLREAEQYAEFLLKEPEPPVTSYVAGPRTVRVCPYYDRACPKGMACDEPCASDRAASPRGAE